MPFFPASLTRDGTPNITEHIAVIGNGYSRHIAAAGFVDEFINNCGAVKQTVLGVAM